jgi:hypothetical protein
MSTINASNLQGPSGTGTAATLVSVNGGQLAGLRNVLVNGGFGIDQRNSGGSVTITAGAALQYTADQWYSWCTGANVTAQRVTVAGNLPDPTRLQYTGAASVSLIGLGQRIEAANCRHLAGQTVDFSVSLSNSLLTTVNWQLFYANTANTFGTLASPTRTSIASGSFTVNSTHTRYTTPPIAIPAAAITGLELVLTVGAQTSGTWTIGNAQLEVGSIATPFEYRPLATEATQCRRYYRWMPFHMAWYASLASQYLETVVSWEEMWATPTASAVVTDPSLSQVNSNQSGNTVSRLTPTGGIVTTTSVGASAQVILVGYRFSLTAVIP